jgi:hypothetical protein
MSAFSFYIDIPLPATRDLNFESQILFEIHKHPFHQKSEPVKAEGIKFRDCLFAFLRLERERERHPTQALFQFSFKQSRNHPLSHSKSLSASARQPKLVGQDLSEIYTTRMSCVWCPRQEINRQQRGLMQIHPILVAKSDPRSLAKHQSALSLTLGWFKCQKIGNRLASGGAEWTLLFAPKFPPTLHVPRSRRLPTPSPFWRHTFIARLFI